MAPPTRARWIDRVAGVAVGSLVTAWCVRSQEATTASAPAIEPAVSEVTAPPEASPAPEAPSALATRPQPVEAPRVEAPVEAPRVDAPPASRVASAAVPGAAPEANDVRGVAPTLPMPRMPGDTRLSSSARFDAAAEQWILKSAFRVHARDHHVIAFYRKALADQGLDVSLSEDAPDSSGAVKTYLHGKSARVHAQVGILPRTDALETRVWILWRSRA